MAIKYKTRWEEIEKVEISRESDSSVWDMNNHRYNKKGEWENYHDTFAEAKEQLRQRELKEIKNYENTIEYHREKLAKIEAIKEF